MASVAMRLEVCIQQRWLIDLVTVGCPQWNILYSFYRDIQLFHHADMFIKNKVADSERSFYVQIRIFRAK